MSSKKEKTNQYINETVLRSLILRINNKLFLDTMSNKFKRLHKYIDKYKNTSNNIFKDILMNRINTMFVDLLQSKSSQLLLLPDDEMKEKIKNIENCKNFKDFDKILLSFSDVTDEMYIRAIQLNSRNNDYKRLEKYVRKHKAGSSQNPQKYKRILRRQIMIISERTIIDRDSHEKFGEMVLLIIKNILKKPKFSGYSYRDEFYSDSTDKIFRYLRNFNHKLISERTNQEANAFSYISQYVHNSIVHIINTQNKETQDIQNYVNEYNENLIPLINESSIKLNETVFLLNISNVNTNLYESIYEKILSVNDMEKYDTFNITYPTEYRINLEEYEKLKSLNKLLNKTIQIQRSKN